MSNGMPWLKHYTNKRNDPRVHVLTLPSKGIYYMLSEVAGQCDAKGAFIINGIQLNEAQIAQLINVEVTDLKRAIREMNKTGLMSVNGHGPFLTDFAREQVPQDERRKQWQERQARKRDKKSDVTPHVTSDKKSDVTRIESESQSQSIESETLLLLTKEHREKLTGKPEWVKDAVKLSANADKPAHYAAAIIKKWIKEGRNKNNATNKANVRRDSGRTKPTEPAQKTITPSERDTAAIIAARRVASRTKSNV